MTIQFGHPESLYWLWLVAGIAVLAWWGLRKRRRNARRFAEHPLLARIAPRLSFLRPAIRAALAIVAIVTLVIALTDPRWGNRYVEVNRRGMDIVFVVDVSRSMLAEDASPNRLDRSRLFVQDAIAKMAGDRIGLVDFAGDSTLRSPLTLNYDALETSLEELTPRSSNRGGSLLGDAIRKAANAFPESEPGGKAIVILTDGEDMDSFPVEAAEKAWTEHGVRIYTVGIGDAVDGARIPVMMNGQPSWLTFEGQEVWSKMDPMLLTEVAEAGGGQFVPAGTRLVDLGTFFEDWITEIDLKDRDEIVAMQSTPRFQWFAGLAFALLLLESLVSERRGKPIPVRSEGALA